MITTSAIATMCVVGEVVVVVVAARFVTVAVVAWPG